MITYQEGGAVFNYRVVGIALSNNQVLLHTEEGSGFWALPGGRGELMEPARSTLKREMREELGIDVKVDRLVWIVENFFADGDRRYHELALYFLMTFPTDCGVLAEEGPFAGTEKGSKLVFQWHPVGGVERIPLYPTFLRTALGSIPPAAHHVVHWDQEE